MFDHGQKHFALAMGTPPHNSSSEPFDLQPSDGDPAPVQMQLDAVHPPPTVPYPLPNSNAPTAPQLPSDSDMLADLGSPMSPNGAPITPPPEGGDAPTSQPSISHIGHPWTTGLFDCGQQETNAVMTAFFPCVTFGQIAEILDEGETSCTLGSFMYILMAPALCTCWILGSNYRQKLRNKYDLVQAPAEDWTVHLFCPCCSLCQEFRELHNRGIDPSLGWMGYLAEQQETRTVPPNSQSMSK